MDHREYNKRKNPHKASDPEYYNWYYQNIVKVNRDNRKQSMLKSHIARQQDHIDSLKLRINVKKEFLTKAELEKETLQATIEKTQRELKEDLDHLKIETDLLHRMKARLSD